MTDLIENNVLDRKKCDADLIAAFLDDLATLGYRFPEIPRQKKFAYMVQGKRSSYRFGIWTLPQSR